MAANTVPVFVLTPKSWGVSIATSNTARDGTGTVGTLLTAGSNGTKVEHIDICAAGTTTAGIIRLFIVDVSANYYLWKEILVSAITPSGSVIAFQATVDCSAAAKALVLPNGWSIRASTHNAETFKLTAFGGDF